MYDYEVSNWLYRLRIIVSYGGMAVYWECVGVQRMISSFGVGWQFPKDTVNSWRVTFVVLAKLLFDSGEIADFFTGFVKEVFLIFSVPLLLFTEMAGKFVTSINVCYVVWKSVTSARRFRHSNERPFWNSFYFFSLDIVWISDYMDSRGFVVIVNGMLHNLCEMVNQPMTSYGIYWYGFKD